MSFVCDRFHIGPFCHDKRLESTPAEKTDCIERAKFACIADIYDCRVDLIKAWNGSKVMAPHIVSDEYPAEQNLKEPLDDLRCYIEGSECLDRLLECWCAGLAGLTCTACNEEPIFDPTPPEEEDDSEDDDKEDETPVISKITFSDTNEPIPLAFGKVALGGNIIYVGSPFAFGTELVVNFVVSFCEGPVDQILRVWIGDQLVIDKTSENATISVAANEIKFSTLLYSGEESQKIIPLEAFGYNVAYRGQAIVFVKNYPLKGVEGRLPEVRVEFATKATQSDVSVDTSTIQADDDSLTFDFFRRRVLSADGNTIRVVDFVELSEVTSITFPEAVRAETLSYTYDRDIVFQDDTDNATFVSGFNYEDVLTYAVGSPVDKLVGARIPSSAQYEIKFLATLDGSVLSFISAPWDTYTFALDFTKTLPFTPQYLGTHYISQTSTAAERLNVVSVGVDANYDIVFYYYPLHSLTGSIDYTSTNVDQTIVVEKELFGVTTATPSIVDVLHLRQENAYILIIQDGSDTRLARVNYGYETSPVWNALLPATPPKMVGADYGESFVYTTADKAYRFFFADGSSQEVYDIALNGAEVPAGACAYDPLTDAVCYVDDNGYLSKILIDRYRTDQVTLEDCASVLLTRAGVPVPFQNISSLSAVLLDGYVVSEQRTASAALLELAEFYHLSVRESSSGITISPLALNSAFSIDTVDYGDSATRVRTVGVAEDSDFVSISYFDEDREYALTSQYITKDVILGIDRESFADNGYSYEIPVYTDATTVRRSAELALLRRLGDVVEVSHLVLPRHLAVEPSDFVTDSNGDTFRVRRTTTDASFMSAISGTLDTQENYVEAPAISGLTYNPTVSTIVGLSLTNNVPFILPAPPFVNSNLKRAIYVGIINPDGGEFVTESLMVGGPYSQFNVIKETFESPVMVGKLISGLDTYTTTSHTTDYINEIVIQFSRDIAPGTFSNKTAVQIYEAFDVNLLFVGQEMIQFQTAVVGMDNRTVTFTGLHRGRFGTEFAKMKHPVGEPCVFYQDESIKLIDLSPTLADANQVHVGTYNSADFGLSRIVRSAYRRISPSSWMDTRVYGTRSAPSGGKQGVTLRAARRAANQAEIFNTSLGHLVIDGTTTSTQYKMYFLKAPFDIDTFIEEQPKGGYQSLTGFTDPLTASTNAYINRYTPGESSADGNERTYIYSANATFIDGLAIDGPIYIALVRDDITKAIGFTFDAGKPSDYAVKLPVGIAV